jgi:hypothetical protein
MAVLSCHPSDLLVSLFKCSLTRNDDPENNEEGPAIESKSLAINSPKSFSETRDIDRNL